MVQGWESRAHLANKRREEARERKQNKKGPQKLSGDVIINQLLNNNLITLDNHSLECWIENERGGKAFCYAHFRAESCCKLKRCKFSHEFTVSHLRGHEYDDSDGGARSEPHMDCYHDLRNIPSKMYKNLKLLYLDQLCIYDRSDPLVWHQWYENTNSRRQKDGEGLQTITEVDSVIPDDMSVMSMGNIEESELENSFNTAVSLKDDTVEDTQVSSSTSSFLTLLPMSTLVEIFSFASDIDICNMFASAQTMKTVILADESATLRRKMYLAEVTPTGKELSKLKKQEKKKKLKQANLKASKRGHKAVKVCRR